MRYIALLLFCFLWPLLCAPGAAQAQVATLIADSVRFGGGSQVIAEGNVEILYDGRRVIAQRIVYDRNTETVEIGGPITVTDEETGAILVGDDARLSQDFNTGLIQGARFLLDGQLQVAAAEMNRVDGRYNQLYKAVASSCRVCSEDEKPLWRIRAKSVVHDQETRQMYFDQAVFEIAGVPVMYFPKLRMPDPTLRRATGFLIPQLKNSSTLGFGIRLPYFIVLGDHADLRLTPFLTGKTRTVEARFRQELSFGTILATGAVSNDNLTSDDLRSYMFVEGRFRLPRDFRLNVDVRLVSDRGYLQTYDYSTLDRLPNRVELTRTSRDEHFSASVEKLRSLRSAEIPIEDTLATLLGRATFERRFQPGLLGGQARLAFDLEGHERAAEVLTPQLQAACASAGISVAGCLTRDVVRAGVTADWQRGWVFGPGIQSSVSGQLATDFYWIDQDTNFAEYLSHITPTAAVELRWPLLRSAANGTRDILEPVVQVAWTDTIGADIPNEDSQLVEFDEGNLLALSRFPGSDRYERGWRSTLGLSWSRLTPSGVQVSATAGRVFRLDDLGQFTKASGLEGGQSDWLLATQFKNRRLTLSNRSLVNSDLKFTKSETQLAWRGPNISASGSYIWVVDDPQEGRTGDTNEVNFNTDYRFARHWTANLSGRYDGNAGEATEAGFGLDYRNECVNVGFSVSRRFTTSTNLEPSTDYGLSVSLNGFGRDGRQNARTCAQKG